MTLSVGAKLGPYEILAPVRAGGMGEVYRSRDTRLNRTVAIKVLPAHLSSNPELKQRLEREARTISSLNHPHICTLYDIGEHESTTFLVMEYLEGETLQARLERGPLPLTEVLGFGVEIAGALESAHRHRVVHRDLKPANVAVNDASGVSRVQCIGNLDGERQERSHRVSEVRTIAAWHDGRPGSDRLALECRSPSGDRVGY